MSELTFDLEGTVPGQVNAGDAITVSDLSWTVTVPGSVLDAGIGLGLLNPGDNVPGTINPAMFATNTVEGTKVAPPVDLTLGPITADPSTGLAGPASATFGVPSLTWTSVGGPVGLSMSTTEVQVSIGAIDIAFTCSPTSASPFAETQVLGSTGRDGSGGGVTVSVAAPRVLGTSVANLPRTGAAVLAPLLLGLGLLDLGYLAHSSTAPARRRNRTD